MSGLTPLGRLFAVISIPTIGLLLADVVVFLSFGAPGGVL